MVLVPLVSLALVEDSVPGSSQVVAGSPETVDDRRLSRPSPDRASRSRASLAAFEAANAEPATTTSTTQAPPPTTTPPTTTAPAKVVAKAAVRVTTTTAKPKPATTTTAKPKPTTTTTKVPPTTTTTTPPNRQEGGASYYESRGPSICAHRTITFGTVVRVTNLANGKATTCTVNDRGPYIDGRIIDLSPQTFATIAPLEDGVIRVAVEW